MSSLVFFFYTAEQENISFSPPVVAYTENETIFQT